MRRITLVVSLLIAMVGAIYVLAPNALKAADTLQVNTSQAGSSGGSYITIRSTVSDTVETIILRLDDDGSATLTTDSDNSNDAIITETGTWVESSAMSVPESDTETVTDTAAATMTSTVATTDTAASADTSMSMATEAITTSLTVTLTAKDGVDYDSPVVLAFDKAGDTLTVVGAEDRYGAEGLTLRLASAAAIATSRSLVNMDLAAGFPLDPTFVSVNGGGEVDVSLLDKKCTGYVHADPVVTVDWSGQSDFVRAFYISDSDSSLVVMGPDGTVYCSDDTAKLILDPTVQIDNPITGTYRIWIGSVAKNQLIPGVLVLTTKPGVTLSTFDLGSFIQRPKVGESPVPPDSVDPAQIAAAIEGRMAKAPALTPDSGVTTATVTADGIVPLFQFFPDNPDCSGLVNAAPDYVFQWTGPAAQLHISFEGNDDSSLLVYSAGADVTACNDDTLPGANINPAVTLEQPPDGVYAVWVGRLDPSQEITGTLTISTDPDAAPSVLAPDASN